MVIFTDANSATEPLQNVVQAAIKKYAPKAVYLREKHLSDEDYLKLAQNIMTICEQNKVDVYICHRIDIARALGVKNIHVSCKNASKIGAKCDFENISVAIHSASEVEKAQQIGATCLVFGHIFETNCKQGLSPRGIESLEEICSGTNLPVIAIGGITRDNHQQVLDVGASDFAIMSSAMTLTF